MCTPTAFMMLNDAGTMQQETINKKMAVSQANALNQNAAAQLNQVSNQQVQLKSKSVRDKLNASLDFLRAGASQKSLFAEANISGNTPLRILETGEISQDINLTALDRAFIQQDADLFSQSDSIVAGTQSQLNQISSQFDNNFFGTIIDYGTSALGGYMQGAQFEKQIESYKGETND